jgi:signal transduction histidine kinase
MSKLVIGFIITVFFIFKVSNTYSQKNAKDSAVQLIRQLDKAYDRGSITPKLYLDTVHATIRSLLSVDINFTNKELLNVLERYRQVIWSDKVFEDEKRAYYGLLSNQAQMTGRSGEMLYYADKFNDLEKADKDRPSITALSIQAGYYNTNNSYDLSQALFYNNRSFILALVNEARKEENTYAEAVQPTILMCHLGEALYMMMDTVNGDKVLHALGEVVDVIKTRFPDNDRAISHALYTQSLLFFYKAEASASAPLVLKSFSLLEKLVQSDKTPEYLKNYVSFFLTEKKLAFFIREKNVDSTAYYLKAFEQEYKKETLVYNAYITQRFRSLALYNEGFYRQSADSLLVALKLLDSARSIATKEVDEMMYAQAKSEEQEILLKEAEKAGLQKERTIRMIFAGVILLFASAAYLVWKQRQRQRKRLLEYKLHMARNIHDETGPALLYAKSLAKSYRTKGNNEATAEELEKQLDSTIAMIRGLSSDIKSPVVLSTSQLVKEAELILKKLRSVNVFRYKIHKKIAEDRFISHYQYANLKSILHECITNSIKHAEFDEIHLNISDANNQLLITYKDDGKGWETNNGSNGIGHENIAERVNRMNGNYTLENNFPQGYEIRISVLLR